MIPKPIDLITKSDIELLIANGVSEGREIEYKVALPTPSDDDKKEFLADVSAMANATGGDLIFGVRADKGVPIEARGLAGATPDSVILRLESILRDGIEPRVNGIRFQGVTGFTDGPVMVVRIPRSWSSPHMVKYKGASRFFVRNNAGKHQMDVGEIRSAFALSESLPERIRQFRDERIGRIFSGDAPLILHGGVKLVLHVVPLASFSGDFRLDVAEIMRNGAALLHPLGGGGGYSRINVDGIVAYRNGHRPKLACLAYTQLFRSGRIEAVDADIVGGGDPPRIPSVSYEESVIQGMVGFQKLLKQLNVPLPWIVMMTLISPTTLTLSISRHFLR